MNAICARALSDEISRAETLMNDGRHDEAMPHLERAHVLGQRFVAAHVRVHWLMFRVALARRRLGDAVGQIARVVLGAVGSAVGVIPVGNTGGSDVNMFRRMPIPPDLARVLEGRDE